MWKDLELSSAVMRICPSCSRNLLNVSTFNATHVKCSTCKESKTLLKCPNPECDLKIEICLQCKTLKSSQHRTKLQPKPNDKKFCLLRCSAMAVAGIIIIPAVLFFSYLKSSRELQDLPNIGRLKQQFPSQNNETWYHILSVLEQKVPTVKSITLLYNNERKTSDCLAKELVNIFSGDVKIGEVNFDLDQIQYTDYGEVLEHYYTVVKRFRVLVTDLSVVPSNIARVFHSLCDEVSSDIKPSLFIFMLQWDEETGHLKPLEKATAILKQAWSDLPVSDIFPLLSRIVKNVVDVVPEKQSTC